MKTVSLIGVFIVSLVSFANEFQSVRYIEDSQQFDEAVSKKKIFIRFDKNAELLKDSPESKNSKLSIEKKYPMFDSQGKLIKELVVRCDMVHETLSSKTTISKTKKYSDQWLVKSIRRVGTMERWVLAKESALDKELMLTCKSFEKNSEDATPVTLVPSLIDKALQEIGARAITSAVLKKSTDNMPAQSSKTESTSGR